MSKGEEEKDMAMPEEALEQISIRKPKRERSNLYSKTNSERLEMIDQKSKKNGGLSNLTYKRVYGEE